VLLGAIAQATTTMRIGSAGIMLPHYAPLKVAEQFRVLEALAPGRVDLGLGRGPGADRQTSYALKPGAMDDPMMMSGADGFAQDVRDVLAWTGGQTPEEGHPFEGIRAQPLGATAPQPWIIGSTPHSAGLAASLGLPFCFAHFFYDGEGAEAALAAYRERFVPGAAGCAPLVGICLWAVAAATREKADGLFAQYALYRAGRDRGRPQPFPGPAEVAGHPAESAWAEKLRARTVCGTPEAVAAGLHEVAARHGADELVILGATHDPADRRESYRLIAEVMGLAAR
jgi:luciferase family oxidoreductase group 1